MSSEYTFIDLSQYKLLFSIGCGGFSQVFRVQDINTGDFLAAKVSDFELKEETQHLQGALLLFREVNLMMLLNHPAILKFIGYSQIDFDNNPCPTIVCEFASNGSLNDIIKMENSGISPDDWNFTKKLINIYGIASGMSYMHSHNVLHRDLKPSNILMNDYLYPKISDFGLSKIYDKISKSLNIQSQNGLNGTSAYVAPEIFSEGIYSKSSDVYAFAFIVFQIMTGEQPFEDLGLYQIMERAAIEGCRPNIKEDVPFAYRNLIERCWSQKAEDRPSFDEIVEELKTNSDYLNESVDKSEFFDYIEFIDKYESTFDVSHIIHFEDFIKIHGKNQNLQKVSLRQLDSNENLVELNKKEILPPIMNKTTDNEVETNSLEIKENKTNNLTNIVDETANLKIKDDETISLANKEIETVNLATKEEKTANLIIKEDQALNLTNKESETVNLPNKEEKTNLKTKEKYDILYPLFEFNKLSKSCQKLVEEARDDSNKQFIVGKSLIEQENDFPRNIHLGIQYIKQSNEGKYLPSVLYYIRQLIKGKFIPQDLNEAEKCLNEINHIEIPQIFVLAGKICKKRNKFKKALQYFEQGLKENDNECMYKYAKMLFLRKGFIRNTKEAIRYLNISRTYEKSGYFLKSLNILNQIKGFQDLNPDTQYIIISNMIKNDQHNIFNTIRIPPNKTDQLFFNKSFKSSIFHKCLSKFQNIFIDLEYPSKSFKKINDLLLKIKNKEKINIQIGICFSSFPIDDNSNCFSSDFSFYKIDRTISKIPKEAFKLCKYLTNILIPFSTLIIDSSAFFGCSSLTTIDIPSSVTTIESSAFAECLLLKTISIPSSVTKIGFAAFSGCASLESIDIPSSVTTIDIDTFKNCISLKTITIPSSVNSIAVEAFAGCSSLIDINIPSSVSSIGSAAFYCCLSLKSINIPSVKFIAESTFKNCTSLASIEIPYVEYIDKEAFLGCSSLSKVIISSVKFICNKAFCGCSSLTSIEIPPYVESISNGTFAGCSSLTSVKIPSSVTTIGINAFSGCISLKNIEIPSSVRAILAYAFSRCKSLKSIEIPPSVKILGSNAFGGCTSLTTAKIPSSLKIFESSAFSGCPSLHTFGNKKLDDIFCQISKNINLH